MREGDHLICPKCGERTILKLRVLRDGFREVGAVLFCPLCGAETGGETTESAAPKKTETIRRPAALEALLGASLEDAPTLREDASDGRFCRRCAHAANHPFFLYCTLRETETDPMGDCEKFEPRKEEKQEGYSEL